MAFKFSPRIVTNGLIFYWDAANIKSYPSSGITVNDLTVNGNNGILVNNVSYNSSNLGSLVFNGVNSYINMGNSFIYNVNTFTISLWVYFNEIAVKEIIVKNPNSGGGVGPFELFQQNNTIGYRINGQTITFFSNYNIVLNKWTYLSYTYNLTNLTTYVSGIIDKNVAYSTPITSTIGNITIGAYNDTQYPFNGRISTVSLHNRALSPSEILQNYNTTKSRYII